jgi:hypothetical protein
MDEETFQDAQAVYEAPAKRGSGVIILELIQAKARRIAFHAAVSLIVRRHGPMLAGQMVAAAMGRPATVWTDERDTVVLAYRQHDPGWAVAV